MPQIEMNISIGDVAKAIKAMTFQEIETLSLMLTTEGSELLKRKHDLISNRVQFLSREEAFSDVS